MKLIEIKIGKYGLPKGYRLVWKLGTKPTGRYSSFETRGSWELNLKYPDKTDDCIAYVDSGESTTFTKGGKIKGLFYRYGDTRSNRKIMKLSQEFETVDQAKEALDKYVIAKPDIWQYYVDEYEKKNK